MGVSLYYEAERDEPLTEQENAKIEGIVKKYSKSFKFKNIGEDFCVYDYDISEPAKIFCGATKLPMTEEPEDIFDACLHWAQCLTEIRKTVLNAVWEVSLDDIELLWDEETGRYFSDDL